MTLITKPDFTYVWASGGAVVAPNDAKKQLGWVAEAPPFQYDNWLQNRQDQMLAHINQRGMPVWDGTTNYEAGSLSYVQGSDGQIYKSVAASGPLTTVQDPTTDATDTYWTVAFASIGAFLTQAAGDARYAQLSNNLSDLTNAATARTNLGVQNAVVSGIAGTASNLKASATGLSALVTVTADSVCVKDTSSNQVVLNSVSVTPSLSASGANGLDTGTSASSTWYYVWIIWNGTTTAGLLSLSSTSPTMPSGYTHKARVGSIRSDASGNKYPLSFVQSGRSVQYKVAAGTNVTSLPQLSSGGSAAWTAASTASFVPSTASTISVKVHLSQTSPAAMYVAESNGYAVPADAPVAVQVGFTNTGITLSQVFRMVLQSQNVYYYVTGTPILAANYAYGWEDNI